jgi:hypothetical protein
MSAVILPFVGATARAASTHAAPSPPKPSAIEPGAAPLLGYPDQALDFSDAYGRS